MQALWVIGVILILVFGFSVSAYVTYYKVTIQNVFAKLIVFLLLGAVVSVITFTISLTLIWPPVM